MNVISTFVVSLALLASAMSAGSIKRPDYTILDYSSVTIGVDDTYTNELCFTVNFKSNWTLTSNGVSMFVSLNKISKYADFNGDGYDVTSTNPFPGTVTGRIFNMDSNKGIVKPGGSFGFKLCCLKNKPRDNLPTQILRSQALLYIGTSRYPSPIDLTDSYLQPITSTNVCPPTWGDLKDYNVYASREINLESSSIEGTKGVKVTTLTNMMNSQSVWLAGLSSTGFVGWRKAPDYKLQLLFPTDATVAIFNVDSSVLPTNKFSLEILNPAYLAKMTYIILNIQGTSVYFSLGNGDILQAYGAKVVYNFRDTTTLSLMSATIYGTIVAPIASVTVGGTSITGKLYAASVTGSKLNVVDQAWDGMSAIGCSDCAPNFYGPTCTACSCQSNQECSDGVAGTGECVCKAGWNEDCNDCAANRFGPECDKVCDATCLSKGECNDGTLGDGTCINCKEPWGGDNCADCAPGFWGKSCQNKCDAELDCSGRGVCNDGRLGDGRCNCTKGWSGEKCDQCDNGHFGPNCDQVCTETCSTRGTCSTGFNGTGECLSCGELFVGKECEGCVDFRSGKNCDECPAGMYGYKCDKKCSKTCLSNGYCDQGPDGTGRCTCKTGWTGSQCQNEDQEDGAADSTETIRLWTALAGLLIAGLIFMMV